MPRVLGHRGAGFHAPENTLAAIRMAHDKLRWRGVEFDAMLAACGTPVLMHDARLRRTTSGAGYVARTPYAGGLDALDAGSWFGSGSFASERVPTLDAALRLCVSLGLFANVEIKPSSARDEAVASRTGELVAQVARDTLDGNTHGVLFSSFSPAALLAAARVWPDAARALLVAPRRSWLLAGRACELAAAPRAREARALGCDALVVFDGALASRETVASVTERDLTLLVWGVGTAARKDELLGWGVRAVITDGLGEGVAASSS